MDSLCDTLMVEEILSRLQPKELLRLRAASRRYNDLGPRPDFAASYWQRAGVFVQPLEQPKEAVPLFLTTPGGNATDLMPGAGLAFLPGPSTEDEEEAAMKLSDEDPQGIVLLHSAAGLLLCCRGRSLTTRYYVCNPVTCQFVALPKHPPRSPVMDCRCGLLTVADGTKSFQVTIMHWPEDDQTFLKLSIFSSDTGQWQMRKVSLPQALDDDEIFTTPPILGQSGTAYFMQEKQDYAIAYNSSSANNSVQAVALPPRLAGNQENRCIGERQSGGLQYANSNATVLEVLASDVIGASWGRWLKVSVRSIMERNPQAAAFMGNDENWSTLKPVGFHPTDEDIVFLALPGAVFAYNTEHGTMDLLCTHDCLAIPADIHPYVHPVYPVQIPAIKDSNIQESRRKRPCIIETQVNGGVEQTKRLRELFYGRLTSFRFPRRR